MNEWLQVILGSLLGTAIGMTWIGPTMWLVWFRREGSPFNWRLFVPWRPFYFDWMDRRRR